MGGKAGDKQYKYSISLLTTEDQSVFGNILQRLLLKPVTVTAYDDEALLLHLLASQPRKHTELILCIEIKQVSGYRLIISSTSHGNLIKHILA